jgi:hypothetical protein
MLAALEVAGAPATAPFAMATDGLATGESDSVRAAQKAKRPPTVGARLLLKK